MDAREARLLALAASISEGTPVDWRQAEDEAAGDAERSLVRELRLLEDVAIACRLGEPEPLTPPARWGSLEVLEKLGSGGFGDVYRAWDGRLLREVALKLQRSCEPTPGGAGSLLLEEGQVLAQVRHPSVVTVHGADRIDGRVGLWMELVRGRTLAKALREEGPLGAPLAASIGIDLCRGLAAIHAAGLVHGDVKAQNVMLEGSRVVLMDPGAGRAGTPAYLAPELRAGARPTARSDVYAVGVLLHHLVTGSFPTDGPLQDAEPDLPAPFVLVVQRALAADPARRYATARDLETALGKALQPPPPPRRDHRFWLVASVAGGVALSITLARLRPDGPWPWTATNPPALHGGLTPPQQSLVEALDRLAALQTAMGAYAEAARSYERAQGVYEAALGPDHVRVADALRRRGWALRALGSRDEARALYERALGIYETRLGREHPTVVAALGDQAAVYEELGSAAKARPLEERARRIRTDRPPVDPFVRPVGVPHSFDAEVARPPAGDGPYTMQVALDAGSAGEVGLAVRSSQPLYIYVLSEDDRDHCSLVFPLPGQEAANPLPPGGPRRLPGARGWRRARLGPSLLVVAAPERLLEFETELLAERVPAGGAPLESVPLSPATLARLRESARVDASARLFEAARPAPEHLEIVRGLWIRRVELGR